MKITSIEKQKTNSERYNIFIDNIYTFSVDLEDIIKFDLKEDKIIEDDELQLYIQKCEINKGYKYALNLLNNLDCSTQQIIDKLKSKGYSENSINEIVNKLKEYGLIDDEKFAKNFVRKNITIKKVGKNKIFNELRKKGISNEIIETLNIDENILIENALSLAIKKNNTIKEEQNKKQKIMRYLYYKGYSIDIIEKVIKKLDIQG